MWEVFAEFFSSSIDLAVVHQQIASVVSRPCVLIVFLQLQHTSVCFFSVSLRMAGLLEVVKVFEDLRGIRSRSSIYLEVT